MLGGEGAIKEEAPVDSRIGDYLDDDIYNFVSPYFENCSDRVCRWNKGVRVWREG